MERRTESRVPPVAMVCVAAALGCAALARAAPGPADPAPAKPEDGAELRAFVKSILGVKGTRGHIRAKSVTWRNFPPATDVNAALQITEDGDWCFENLRGDQCGGRMMGRADIRFGGPDRKFDFAAKWVGVRLEEVTRYTKRPVTPGILSATAELKVTSKGREGLSGDIKLQLRNGNLGRFPMVLKTLSLLSFPGIEKEGIENADARMTLTPRAIVFQDLSLGSTDGAFRLVGERLSSVSYEGKLDVYFRPVIESRLLARVPAVGELVNKVIDDIQQRGMRIHVTGDTAAPRFQWAAFKVRRD
ncbi:MAG: hypothetical protein ACYTKD_14805 [Planctomycetota bacterium]|jgi:hypothetical protein